MNDPVIVATKSALSNSVKAAAKEAVDEILAALREHEADSPAFGWVPNARAMDMLDLSRPTLARYRADGTLPYSKIGASVYYKLEDVEALLESGRRSR